MAQGKIACFSAAKPGQVGHHHVSCYPVDWWVKLRALGLHLLPGPLGLARDLGGGYFGMTGMVYVRDSEIDAYGLNTGGFE